MLELCLFNPTYAMCEGTGTLEEILAKLNCFFSVFRKDMDIS